VLKTRGPVREELPRKEAGSLGGEKMFTDYPRKKRIQGVGRGGGRLTMTGDGKNH